LFISLFLKVQIGPHIVSAIVVVHLCALYIGAETDAEHVRLDLALDESVDLKSATLNLCYNPQYVCATVIFLYKCRVIFWK